MASLGGSRDLCSTGIGPATLAIPQSINAGALATFTVEALFPVLVEFCGGWEQWGNESNVKVLSDSRCRRPRCRGIVKLKPFGVVILAM